MTPQYENYIPKMQNKNRKEKKSVALLSLGIGILTAFLAASTTISQIQISDAKSKIQQYTVWLRSINSAMTNTRRINFKIKAQKIQGADAQVMRYNNIMGVANAYAGAEGIVGDLVSKNASLFNQFNENIADLSSETISIDAALRYYMIRNNLIISLKIKNQLNIIQEAQKSTFSKTISNFEDILIVTKNKLLSFLKGKTI